MSTKPDAGEHEHRQHQRQQHDQQQVDRRRASGVRSRVRGATPVRRRQARTARAPTNATQASAGRSANGWSIRRDARTATVAATPSARPSRSWRNSAPKRPGCAEQVCHQRARNTRAHAEQQRQHARRQPHSARASASISATIVVERQAASLHRSCASSRTNGARTATGSPSAACRTTSNTDASQHRDLRHSDSDPVRRSSSASASGGRAPRRDRRRRPAPSAPTNQHARAASSSAAPSRDHRADCRGAARAARRSAGTAPGSKKQTPHAEERQQPEQRRWRTTAPPGFVGEPVGDCSDAWQRVRAERGAAPATQLSAGRCTAAARGNARA